MKTHIHRGETLAAVVKKTRTKVSDLIRRVHISRGTYYNHIRQRDLPFEILEMYGKALRYDFSEDFPKMPKYSLDDEEGFYSSPKTLDEAIRQIEYWKNKYIRLSDKFFEKMAENGKGER